MLAYVFLGILIAAGLLGGAFLLRGKLRADRRLRAAIAVLPSGIGLYDKYDRLYLWNRPYQDLTGMGGKALREGIPFREILEEDLHAGFYAEAVGRESEWLEQRLALRARGEGSREQDLRDGRWLNVADRRTPDGGTVSICTDITEAKNGSDSLQLMFDSNPVPMWLWEGTRELPVIDLNAAARQHLGYGPEDLAGLTIFDLLSPEERPTLEAMISAKVGRPYKGERVWRPRRKDGTLLYAIPYIHILPRVDGKPRFVAAIVDVTSHVRLEEELRRNGEELAAALKRAEAGSRAKDEFLSAISHELRTPLNAVLGFSELLSNEVMGPLGNPRYADYAGSIHSSGKHLLRIINDILDITRLDAGQLTLTPEPVDVESLIEDCIKLVSLRAESNCLRIGLQVAPDAKTLVCDGTRLKQIVLNLLSNAVKFTPPGGQVDVTAARRGDMTAITVRDTGIGMRREDIPKALERFGQIDSSLSRKYEGTGLGLPLARQLAELHGGSLEIDSEAGAGTSITILLPSKGAAVLKAVA